MEFAYLHVDIYLLKVLATPVQKEYLLGGIQLLDITGEIRGLCNRQASNDCAIFLGKSGRSGHKSIRPYIARELCRLYSSHCQASVRSNGVSKAISRV